MKYYDKYPKPKYFHVSVNPAREMPLVIKACMGGFCNLREKCRHYVAPGSRTSAAERLCTRGEESAMFFTPLRGMNQPPIKAYTEAETTV